MTATQFRVLGSLEAAADGAVAELGPPKQRALLASLLLHVGEIVPVDRLIELLWGEDAPRTAPHSIQIYVSDLRRALEPLGASDLIVTRQPGYVLATDRASIDAWRFEDLVHDGVRLLEGGDRNAGRSALRQALALWRGPALSDFSYEEFAQPYIRRLNEMHLDAIEVLGAAELEAGRASEVVSLLEAAVLDDPLRERSRELLMLALYRLGRHADALRTFDALRTALADELGVDPSPQLRNLYDRILLHDASLLPVAEAAGAAARNPYKGLRAFTEQDAPDFFGREDLVERLLSALAGGARLVSLVGPSGSGKSSVVAAGLVPRLRAGALAGAERWRIVRMVPGANPLREAEAMLGASLAGNGQGEATLLVIDQFEQVFAVTEDQLRQEFLDLLAEAVSGPDAALRVVLTLRADLYDRPLLHPAFAAVFNPSVVNVVPMTARELEAAVVEPARRVGVDVEPTLLAELVADTANQPGSLPLLQYALTDLFDHRTGPTLTRAGYVSLGGLRGLLSRRAESLYLGMDADAQAAAMQVLLRLVRTGAGDADSRRQLPLAELTDLGINGVVLSEVLTTFGRYRLLTFDRDPVSGRATVEVAHDALLVEWVRLAGWIERHRTALRRHGALMAAAEEWELSGRDQDYLLSGGRLQEFESWLTAGVLQLSGRERAFLEAGVEKRRTAEAEATARLAEERRRQHRIRRRFVALAGVVFVLAAALVYALLVGLGPARTVALLTTGVYDELTDTAFDQALADFELVGRKVRVADEGATASELRSLSEEGPALIVISPAEAGVEIVAPDFPDIHYLNLNDPPIDQPNVANVAFRSWEGAFLAGAAAALRSETGVIGMVGGADHPFIWWFQAGFEEGAHTADPGVDVRTIYLEVPDENLEFTWIGFTDHRLAEQAARQLYAEGADVVFQVAGTAGLGVFDAAVDMSDSLGRHLWAIGVDSDQYDTVTRLPGVTRAEAWRSHILTSVVKRFDMVVYSALEDFSGGAMPPALQIHDLESGLVDISYGGGFIDEFRPEIESYRRQIIAGQIAIRCIPDARLFVVEGSAAGHGVSLEEELAGWCL